MAVFFLGGREDERASHVRTMRVESRNRGSKKREEIIVCGLCAVNVLSSIAL